MGKSHHSLTLDALAKDFLGLSQSDSVVDLDGRVHQRRRVYLDTTASSLMPRPVWKGLEKYLNTAAANSHTYAHRAGRATTDAIEAARDAVGRFVGYNPEIDQVLFTGNGATGALNFLARVLFPHELRLWLRGNLPDLPVKATDARGERALTLLKARLERPLVVTSVMEHHSNLLPWVEAVGRDNLRPVETLSNGTLDLQDLENVLEKEGRKVSIVAINGTSNVTGVINDIHAIAKLAHRYGAKIVVDAAQMAPHQPIRLHTEDPESYIDFVALSGHKMYAPGSRGALVGRLAPVVGSRCIGDVGGGMAAAVSLEDFRIVNELTAREEAGTPNIPGTVSMGLAAELLMAVGMDKVQEREHELNEAFLNRLAKIDGVKVYGPGFDSEVDRAGVITLNVGDLPDGLVATYLDHGWNIAVRNGCFCAHPYVKRLLGVDKESEQAYLDQLDEGDWRYVPGMVRVSLGVYSTLEDLEVLAKALEEISARKDDLLEAYEHAISGAFVRKDPAARKVLETRPFTL